MDDVEGGGREKQRNLSPAPLRLLTLRYSAPSSQGRAHHGPGPCARPPQPPANINKLKTFQIEVFLSVVCLCQRSRNQQVDINIKRS